MLVVALLVVVLLRFVLPRKTPVSETSLKPVSILIADFQNKTGDTVFDGAIEQLLGISLEGAPFISIYDRPKARELANQLDPGAGGRLTADLAQLVSNREGVNVVIDASIEQSGDGYLITVWTIDPAKNEKIAEVSRKIKTKAEVGKAADFLSTKLRSELGDVQPESAQAFAQETFTASSLVAMNAFARGQELMYLGKREEAITWFLRALDNDPNLGRAYVSLAAIYTHRQQHEEAEKYFQMAMARIDQMSEREKHRTRGTYYIVKRNIPKAIEEYSALVEKFPFDSVGYLNLALSYFYARDMAKAAEMGRKAVDLDPKKALPRYNLVWYLIGAGDYDVAEQEVHALLNLEPNYIEAYVCRALLELARGQSAQATETYRELEAKNALGAALASTGLADIAAYEGRLSDAITVLKQGIVLDLENAPAYIAADKYIFLAQIYILQGKKDLALDAADRAVAASKLEEFLFSAAEIFMHAGQEDKARNLAWELSKKIQPIHRAYAKLIGGELSMARGDIPGAIQLFQEAQALVNTWLGRFLLGRAYLESEAYAEAYSEFEECLRRQGEATSVFFNDLPSYRYLPPVYYYLGRAQEGLKSPAAKGSYETFLLIKEKGEEDWMVEDARRRVNTR
jgi:tetratricopeptide (TPR) repeat protein